MVLQSITNRSLISKKLAGAFVAIFALFIQPLVALDVPSAFAASGTPGSVVINEFSSQTSSDWVELYNTTGSNVDTTGWKLKDSGGNEKSLDVTSISGGGVGFAVQSFSNHLDVAGDTITLVDDADTEIDSVTYGAAGVVAAPGHGQYAARVTDGSVTWELRSSESQGATNKLAPSATLTADGLLTSLNVNEADEFTSTMSSVANAAGVNVRVKTTFTAGDPNDVVLEYLENAGPNQGTYQPLQRVGDDFYFGPVSGFPLHNATSNLRITYKKAGTYVAVSRVINMADQTVVAQSALVTVVVNEPAGTRYVATDGDDTANNCLNKMSPCKTIQHAVDVAVSGDGIQVAKGEYQESVNITKSVQLLGAQMNNDPRPSAGTNRGVYTDETTVKAPVNAQAFKIAADNVTINGFQVEQTGGSVDAIKASSSHNNLTISNNIVNDAKDEAIQLEAGNNHSVTHNYIVSPKGDGITLSTYSPKEVSDLSIIENDISGSTSTFGSIYLYGVKNVTVRGNVIDAPYTGIAVGSKGLPSHNVTITGNTINLEFEKLTYVSGISVVDSSSNVAIVGNTIKQTSASLPNAGVYSLVQVGLPDTTGQPSGVKVTHNNFTKVGDTDYIYVYSDVATTVDAKENWWNSDENPSAKVTSANATVAVEPWLCGKYTGQTNPMTSKNGVCDSEDPVVTVNPVGIVKKDTAFTVTGTVSDKKDTSPEVKVTIANTSYTATVSGQNWTVTIPASNSLVDGQYDVKVTATDDYGNSSADVHGSVTIDGTAPVFTKSALRNADGSYTLSATSSDTDIDVSTVQLLLNGTQQLPVTVLTNGDGSRTWSAVTAPLVNGLTYTFMVKAADMAGNATTASPQSFTVPASIVPQTQDSSFTNTTKPLSPLLTARVASSAQVASGLVSTPVDVTDKGEVLGTNTKEKNTKSDENVAAIAPSEEGWKLWGVAWYWWLLALGALGFGGWYAVRRYRGPSGDF